MFYKLDKIAFAGDWHGNTYWAQSVIRQIAESLADEDEKVIIQLGDFGFWPGKWGQTYIESLQKTLDEVNADLLFIDGNHENHATLKKLAKSKHVNGQSVPCPVSDRITWLQRGTRFKVNDKTYLALGGAASVDRQWRTENTSWFPAERITPEQKDAAIADGPATVLLSHDAPADVPITFPPVPVWPSQDLALSQVNREYLQEVVDACGINYVMHGHMHMSYEKTVRSERSYFRANCFNCDGSIGNWGIMNAKTMEWIDGR